MCHHLKTKNHETFKTQKLKILTDFAEYPCMMSLLPDLAGLHLFLIHLCPLMPSVCHLRFLLLYWKSGPSIDLFCLTGSQVPLHC